MHPTDFHPDLRAAARWLPRGVVKPWLLPLLRRLPAPSQKLPAGVIVTARPLDGRGTASLRILRSTPSDGPPRPAVLWIHGGGYVIGRAKTDDARCAHLAKRLGATVFSVDYRLAPEHPFPTPLDAGRRPLNCFIFS